MKITTNILKTKAKSQTKKTKTPRHDLSLKTIKDSVMVTGASTLATSLGRAPEIGLGLGVGYSFGKMFSPNKKPEGETAVLHSPLSRAVTNVKHTSGKQAFAAVALSAITGVLGAAIGGPTGLAFGISFGAGFSAAKLS